MKLTSKERHLLLTAQHKDGLRLGIQDSDDAGLALALSDRGLVRIEPPGWNWHDGVAFITDAGNAALSQ